jgi:hypothetical protein
VTALDALDEEITDACPRADCDPVFKSTTCACEWRVAERKRKNVRRNRKIGMRRPAHPHNDVWVDSQPELTRIARTPQQKPVAEVAAVKNVGNAAGGALKLANKIKRNFFRAAFPICTSRHSGE